MGLELSGPEIQGLPTKSSPFKTTVLLLAYFPDCRTKVLLRAFVFFHFLRGLCTLEMHEKAAISVVIMG